MSAKALSALSAPSGNLSSVNKEELEDTDSLDPEDNLEYTGVWCTSVADIYMATSSYVPEHSSANFVSVTSVPLEEEETLPIQHHHIINNILPLEETVFPSSCDN